MLLEIVKFFFDTARPCGAMDSALDFGSSGCGFESHQGRMASVAQLDSASVFGTEGRGFESLRAYHHFHPMPQALMGLCDTRLASLE